ARARAARLVQPRPAQPLVLRPRRPGDGPDAGDHDPALDGRGEGKRDRNPGAAHRHASSPLADHPRQADPVRLCRHVRPLPDHRPGHRPFQGPPARLLPAPRRPDLPLPDDHPGAGPSRLKSRSYPTAGHGLLRLRPHGPDDLSLGPDLPDRKHASRLPDRQPGDPRPLLRQHPPRHLPQRLGARRPVARSAGAADHRDDGADAGVVAVQEELGLTEAAQPGTHLQQSGGTSVGCWPSGQAAQRTVEQSIFLALEPLVSVVEPVVVPVTPVSEEPVEGTLAAVDPGGAAARPGAPWRPTSPPTIVSPWCVAQAQSVMTARSPVNCPNFLIGFIVASFRSATQTKAKRCQKHAGWLTPSQSWPSLALTPEPFVCVRSARRLQKPWRKPRTRRGSPS